MTLYRIFGDSHCNAIGSGMASTKGSLELSDFEVSGINALGAATEFYKPFHHLRAGRVILSNPKFAGRLSGLCDESGIMFGTSGERLLLCCGLHTQTILAGRLFRDHAPHFVKPSQPKGFMSESALEAVLLNYSKHLLSFLADMRAAGFDVTIISAPPATRRYNILRLGYSVADLVALDAFMRRFVSDRIKALGVRVITPPEDVIGDDGLMRDDYMHENENDPHHGNAAYGAVMLRHIAEEVAAKKT